MARSLRRAWRLVWAKILGAAVPALCVATVAVAFPLMSAHAASAAGAPLPALGVNVHSMWDSASTYGSEYSTYKTMGATWIRTDVYWDQIEPANGQMSSGYLRELDGVVATAHADGLNSLLTVSHTPAWAAPAGGTPASPPTNPQTYGAFMAFLAARYQGDGVALEMWNEPDLAVNFTGTSAATYATLACATYADIKAASPTTTVVAGAVTGEDISWLRQAFAAGMAGCFDVLSEHPYPTNAVGSDPARWEPVFITPQVHALMAQYGDGSKPIWFTEFGFSANGNGVAPGAGQITAANQATYTVRFLQVVAATLPYVPVAMVYEGKDTLSASTPYEAHFGLLEGNLSPKPVVQAVKGLYNGTNVPPLPTDPAIPPTVAAASPASGPSGTPVTITGTDLTGATKVVFGTTAATKVTVNSPTQITVIAPTQVAGPETIWVTTPSGVNPAGARFAYLAPTVTSVNPLSGPRGATVTISGSNFTGATKVVFGTTTATSVTVNSPTQITAVAPTQPPGAETIWVTTPTGTNPAGPGEQYTYAAAPAVTSAGPAGGGSGTTVTITGSNFIGTTRVVFGTVAATNVTVNSATQITAIAPAQPPGAQTIWVTTQSGTNAKGASFTYLAPAVTSASPLSGPSGATVTVTGTNFTGATRVAFGTVAASSFSVNSSTQITATAPAQAAGAETIWVTTPTGTNPAASGAKYTYVVPNVSALSPASGAGGTSVTVTGTNLAGATKVAFGTVAASFTVNSNSQITAIAPAQAAGAQTIWITTPGGTNPSNTGDRYTYPAS